MKRQPEPHAKKKPEEKWRLGTMGFGYDDWNGVFYPKSLPSSDRLSFYAKHFNAVELDTTFHAAPDAARVRKWADATPAGFRFCAKTPREITHDLPLAKAGKPMNAFLDVMREMREKLAVILLQFAPSFAADQSDELQAFLKDLPSDIRYAVELRNRTWGTQRTLEMLAAANCALVSAEYLTRPARILSTTDFLYVRWIGQHGRFRTQSAEQIDVSDSLAWWKSALEKPAEKAKAFYGFFNNDYAGYAVATCNRFKKLIGLQAIGQPQASLFGESF
jgi:uncharacterized protein YecE (DUF72 family)